MVYHLWCRKQSKNKQQNGDWFWKFWSEQNWQQHTSVVHTVARAIQTRLTSSGQACRMGKGCRIPFLNITFQRKVRTALVVGKLCTFRNTYLQTWVHQHCQEGQTNLLIVCLHVLSLAITKYIHKKKDLQPLLYGKITGSVFKPEKRVLTWPLL